MEFGLSWIFFVVFLRDNLLRIGDIEYVRGYELEN